MRDNHNRRQYTRRHGGAVLIPYGNNKEDSTYCRQRGAVLIGTIEDSTYRRQRGAVLIGSMGPMVLHESCLLTLLQRTEKKDGDNHSTLSNEEEG